MFRKFCSVLIFLAISTAAIADKPETKIKRFQSQSTSESAVQELVADVNKFLGDAELNQKVLGGCEELAKHLERCAKREAPKSPKREALNKAAAQIREVANHKENGWPMLTNNGRKALAEVAAALQAAGEKHGFADPDQVKHCAETAQKLAGAAACRVANAQLLVSVKWGNVMVLVKYEDGDERSPRQIYMRGASSGNDLEQVDAEVLAIMNRDDAAWDLLDINGASDVLLTYVVYHLR
jgi:hypothetical protein